VWQGNGFKFAAREKRFCLPQSVQTKSGYQKHSIQRIPLAFNVGEKGNEHEDKNSALESR
jgi:hypothetical protein